MILTVTMNPSVDKISEVPGLSLGRLNSVETQLTQPGGKGVNIAFMLAALGHEITAMGFAGDGPGRFIQNLLRDARITTAFTPLQEKTRTNYAIIDTKAGAMTTLRSPGPQVDPWDIAAFRTTYERLLGVTSFVVIAGSLPPGVESSFCTELVRLAVSRGIRVAVVNAQDEVVCVSGDEVVSVQVPRAAFSERYGWTMR